MTDKHGNLTIRAGSDMDSSQFSGWERLLDDATSDLSLAPPWTVIAAQSAGMMARLRFALETNRDGFLSGYAAFLEDRQTKYALPLLVRELVGNRLVAYHNEICGQRIDAVLDAVLDADGNRCDMMHVPSVPRGSSTHSIVETWARRRGFTLIRVPGNRSPYFAVEGTWEEFLAAQSKNFRYTLNRKRKALAKNGEVTVDRLDKSVDVPRLLLAIEAIEASSWKAKAGMAISGREQEMAYYRSLLPWLTQVDALAAVVVSCGGKPAAYSLCTRWHGRYSQLKTSFVEEWHEASPGLTANSEAIKQAYDEKGVEFDFLGDVMPHKVHWTSLLREHDDLFVYTNTLSGRVVGVLKKTVSRLRPAGPPLTLGRGGKSVEV